MSTQLATKEINEVVIDVPQNTQMQTTSGNTALISMIERAAINKDVDIEKMERLMLMHEKAVAKQEERDDKDRKRSAKLAFINAKSKVGLELEPVIKNSTNDHTHSSYADLGALAKAANPIIAKNGFAVSYSAKTPENGYVHIDCHVAHEQGHVETVGIPFPLDAAGSGGKTNKTQLQALGSTMSYARRYLKFMAFDIATTDDNDGQRVQQIDFISGDQVTELVALADEYKIDKAGFCKTGNVNSFSEISIQNFEPAKRKMKSIYDLRNKEQTNAPAK